jgi:acyl-CoA synthetase (NDP forming)
MVSVLPIPIGEKTGGHFFREGNIGELSGMSSYDLGTVLGNEHRGRRRKKMEIHDLEVFMAPRSVVVIGVSRKTGRGSFNLIENIREFGFRGEIYPVNPSADEIGGLKVYKDVRDIGKPIDLAIIATPREEVPRIAEQCANLGIKGAIVVPQGFADADAEGKALQEKVSEIARNNGIRILGPNTLGVANAFSGFTSSFMPIRREKVPVGVIAQSGIFLVGSPIFTGMMGKGIDVGNGCDLDFADALEYFGADEEIRVIFIQIEGMRQGKRFFEVARTVARAKPILGMKTARSPEGARAASSHSGSMVGNHEVFDAAFRQAGIIAVRNQEEVLDFTKAFLHLRPMNGNRLGVITFTGAGGIMMVDTFQDHGLDLVDFSPNTIWRIKELSPSWMSIGNPMDIWPALMKHGMNKVYRTALENILRDPLVDAVVCIAIAPLLPEQEYLDVTGIIKETAACFSQKPVVAWLYGQNQEEVSRALEEGGRVLAFPTLARVARTLAALYRRGQFLNALYFPS